MPAESTIYQRLSSMAKWLLARFKVPLYKYAMPVWVSWWNVSQREDVFPGRSPSENHPPEGRHSIRIPTLAWYICFIIPNNPQFGKISTKTTMTAGRSSENGGRFAGGHFAGGHDGMANLCKPITAYDFHVRYNKAGWSISLLNWTEVG